MTVKTLVELSRISPTKVRAEPAADHEAKRILILGENYGRVGTYVGPGRSIDAANGKIGIYLFQKDGRRMRLTAGEALGKIRNR